MAQHATREAEVDDLLRRERLRRPAHHHQAGAARRASLATRSSRSSGSPGSCARPTWVPAPTPCSATSAGATTGDPAELDGIARYNEEDCRATLALRDWLRRRTAAGGRRPAPDRRGARTQRGRRGRAEQRARRCARRSSTARSPGARAGSPASCSSTTAARRGRAGGGTSRCREMDDEELMRRREALGRLEPAGRPRGRRGTQSGVRPALPRRRSTRSSRRRWVDPATGKGVNVVLASTTTRLRRHPSPQRVLERRPLPRALMPAGRSRRRRSRGRSCGSPSRPRRHGAFPALRGPAAPTTCPGSRPCRAARRSRPPISPRQQRLARSLDECTLVVQGPPGTGKTYPGARLIVDLIASGQRVGVTAISHKAINNLLAEVEARGGRGGVAFEGARKCSGRGTTRARAAGARSTSRRRRGLPRRRSIGSSRAPPWLFAPEPSPTRSTTS